MLPRICRRQKSSLLKIYCVVSTVLLLWKLFAGTDNRNIFPSISSDNTIYSPTRREHGNQTTAAPVLHIVSTPAAVSRSLLTKASTADIHIFTVVGVNTTTASGWDIFAVTTWVDPIYLDVPVRCCFLYRNKSIAILPTHKVHQRRDIYNKTGQFQCLNPDIPSTRHLKGVSLSVKDCCSSNEDVYVKPDLPLAPAGSFNMAVCAKIAYGRLDSELTLEWFEYHKMLGVTHVLAFQYKLSKSASAVLQYYKDTGFLELREFDFPNQDCPHRFVGGVTIDAWNDEQVALFDCQARLHGYQYVAVIDFDEFIVPVADDNLKDLMNSLVAYVPLVGAFEFLVDVYAFNWTPDSKSRLLVTQYVNRTTSLEPTDVRKVIHIPARTQLGTVFTHQAKVKDGHKIFRDPTRFFSANHYRACKYEWKDCYTRQRIQDKRILNHAYRITDKVRYVRREILKTCPACKIGV